MHDTLTPPSTEEYRPSRARRFARSARAVAAGAVVTAAMLFTGLTALLAVMAPDDGQPDVAWGLAGMAAVVAIGTWVAALILTRVSGWALYVAAAVLVLLTAIGIYGGSRGSETGVLVVSLVATPAWVATVLWNRAGARHRPRGES